MIECSKLNIHVRLKYDHNRIFKIQISPELLGAIQDAYFMCWNVNSRFNSNSSNKLKASSARTFTINRLK